MKKFILSAMTVAAVTIGGVAQADIIDGVGNTISRIFGIPYSPTVASSAPVGTIYTDAYGRSFQVDATGRHVPIAQYPQPSPYAAVPGTYAVAPAFDTDADGVPDHLDRSPYDARYR
jgi:hypothetical protein